MHVLIPHEPYQHLKVDSAFASEYDAAKQAGFQTALYDDLALQAGDVQAALKRVTSFDTEQSLIFRGWMMPGERYHQLYAGLVDRGAILMTSPDAYEEAHYLPNAYNHIKGGVSPRRMDRGGRCHAGLAALSGVSQ